MGAPRPCAEPGPAPFIIAIIDKRNLMLTHYIAFVLGAVNARIDGLHKRPRLC